MLTTTIMAFWTTCDIIFAAAGGLQNWFVIYVFSIAVGAGAGSVTMMLLTTVIVWIDLIQRTSKLSAKQSSSMRLAKLVLRVQVRCALLAHDHIHSADKRTAAAACT